MITNKFILLVLFIQHFFITWDQNRPLKFEDFKYTPQTEQEYSALTACKLYFDQTTINDSIKYDIHFYFICDSSFICCDDSILLAHEQGHFDISEIYARMLRKKYIELVKHNSSLDSIYSSIYVITELINLNTKYDSETDHGKIYTENERWKLKIEKMLDSLRDYDKPKGTISIR